MEQYKLDRDIPAICVTAASFPAGIKDHLTAQELLADPRIDPQGACIEVYDNMQNVRCMVRLDPSKL